MKTALNVIGVVLTIIGIVWVLQGAGWLGGSFMTGERQWLVIGAVCVLAGIAALLFANRTGRARR